MASLIHMHIENYATRNVVDDYFPSEVALPAAAGPAATVSIPSRTTPCDLLVVAVDQAIPAVAASFAIAPGAKPYGTVTIHRDTVELYTTEAAPVVAFVPRSIATRPVFDWLGGIIERLNPAKTVIVDSADKPTAVLRLEEEVTIFGLGAMDGVEGLAALPPPLMLDGPAAYILTKYADAPAAIAIRMYAMTPEATSFTAAAKLSTAVRDAVRALTGSVIDGPLSKPSFTAFRKKLRATTASITAAELYA